MSEGRTPAQYAPVFGRAENVLSSTANKTGRDSMHETGACQQLPWPNYCSHTPDRPEFFSIPQSHKQRSCAITEAMDRLEAAYYNPQEKLPTLQNHTQTSGNQVKSQRRNATISVLQVMLYYVDDASGRVGRRTNDGKFEDLSIKKISELTGIRFKRAKRAIKQIIAAGYLFVTRQFKRAPNGEYVGLPSIKEFTPKFFMELDIKGEIWQKWVALKNWRKEKNDKKGLKADKKKARAAMTMISEGLKFAQKGAKKAMSKIGGIVKGIPAPKAGKSQACLNHERKLRLAAMELHRSDPTPSLSDYYKELEKKYPPPA